MPWLALQSLNRGPDALARMRSMSIAQNACL
jgi:hypothetical protein